KDLYINYINPNPGNAKIKKLSLFTSLFIGVIVFLLSLNPPDLLVWINLFALAGQEAAFFCPIILGLYWKRANAVGAISSMIFGVSSYIYFSVFKVVFSGLHQIVPVILMSLVVFVIGSYLGEKPDDETIDIFFNL
ncbi:MAG: sodium:solute symporter family transporter, partial [Cetobacterium sp.]